MKPETEIRNLKRQLERAYEASDSWRDEAARERQKWQASQRELTEVKARNEQLAEQLTLALRAMNARPKESARYHCLSHRCGSCAGCREHGVAT